MNARNARSVLVLGGGAAAAGLIERLGQLPNVASVRHLARYVPGTALPDANLCVEMLEGISVAHSAALQALRQGMALVITSPNLAAIHGGQLQQAAAGQGAYFACAAHGLVGVPGLLVAMQAISVLMLTDTPAQHSLFRLQNRGLGMATIGDHPDASGKLSHSRAHALLGAWLGVWAELPKQPRTGVDGIDASINRLLPGLGLQLAYGSRIEGQQIYTGPIALPQAFTAPLAGQELVLAETPNGPFALTLPTSGAAAATLQAVEDYALGLRPLLRHKPQQKAIGEATPAATLIVAPLAARAGLIEQAKPLAQHFAAELWAAVLPAPRSAFDWPEGTLAVPLALPYAAQAQSQLRLVG